ncbi:hypothetical protein Pen01_22170 [Phytomonospora endophytica]|nr:hypothetical protein Pen01_22170 [Phytomonospora endophytica]
MPLAEQSAQASTCPPVAWTEAEAVEIAVECSQEVEVLSLRSETGTMVADLTGELTWSESVEAERVQEADGTWLAADASLEAEASGTFRPAAATVDYWFPGAGHRPEVFAQFGASGLILELETGGATVLSAPTITDDVATYPEVMPGVDLELTAGVDGFSHVLVVKTPEAAASPMVRDAAFRLKGDGVVLAGGGDEALRIESAATGTTFLEATSAYMWDSAGQSSGVSLDAKTAGGPKVAELDVSIEGDLLKLGADEKLLDSPTTVYPVYIDPVWTAKKRSAWATLTDIKGSYYNAYHPPFNKDGGGVKVGKSPADGMFTARSLFKMPLSGVAGKTVTYAEFSMTQGWSSRACGTSEATRLYEVPAFGSSVDWNTSWNSSGSGWQDHIATNDEVRRYDSSGDCAKGRVEWGITDEVATAVDDGRSHIYLGLKAADEGSTNSWKKYVLDAHLTVKYNTPPQKPESVTVMGKKCATGAARPMIGAGALANDPVTIGGKLKDVDAAKDTESAKLTAQVWWSPLGDGWSDTRLRQQPGLGHNSAMSVELPTLADGKYAIRVRAKDKIDSGGFVVCEFEVDTAKPGTPAEVDSADYPSSEENANGSGGIGQAGTFTIAPPANTTDIAGYHVTLNDESFDAKAPVAAADAAGNASVRITPSTYDSSTLRVWTVDKAGNVSDGPRAYNFTVLKSFTEPTGAWSFDVRDGTTIVDESGNGRPLTPVGTPATVPGHILQDSGAGFTGTSTAYNSPAPGTVPIIDTTKGFSVSTWVRINALTTQQTVIAQSGVNQPGFLLEYHLSRNRWNFSMPGSDIASPTWSQVSSTAAPTVGRWTHLVAVYAEGAPGTMSLYVDGKLQGTPVSRTTAWKAPGRLWVGQSATTAGVTKAPLAGAVDDLRIWNRAVNATEAGSLYGRATKTGHWALDDEGTGVSSDASGYGNPMTLGAGAAPTSDGKGVQLTGNTCPTVGEPVVFGNTSFSVAAWVKLTDKGDHRNVITQTGVNRPGFYLQYVKSTDRWRFTMPKTDTASTTFVSVDSLQVAVLHSWTHLAATFEAATGEMRLYVNGELAGTAVTPAPWSPTGPLRVGCAATQANPAGYQHFVGSIDDVQVYAGVLAGGNAFDGTPTVKRVLTGANRPMGGLPDRDLPENNLVVESDDGQLVIQEFGLDQATATWGSREIWRSPNSDYGVGENVYFGDFTGDGERDVAILMERQEYEYSPCADNGILTVCAPETIYRHIEVDLYEIDEFGLSLVARKFLGSAETAPGTGPLPPLPWSYGENDVAVGDVDGDGDDDLVRVVSEYHSGGHHCAGKALILPAVAGEFGASVESTWDFLNNCSTYTHIGDLAVEDLNGDGAEDLELLGGWLGQLGVAVAGVRSLGAFKFAAPVKLWETTQWNNESPYELYGADINGNADDPRVEPKTGKRGQGFADLVVTAPGTVNGTWIRHVLRAVPGSFALQSPYPLQLPQVDSTPVAQGAVLHTDVDRDGDGDALVVQVGPDSAEVRLFTNDAGAFTGGEPVLTLPLVPGVYYRNFL